MKLTNQLVHNIVFNIANWTINGLLFKFVYDINKVFAISLVGLYIIRSLSKALFLYNEQKQKEEMANRILLEYVKQMESTIATKVTESDSINNDTPRH